MKIIAAALSVISLSVLANNSPADTTIKGVRVRFTYSTAIFPESWQPSPINAWGEQIASSEIQRCKMIDRKSVV